MPQPRIVSFWLFFCAFMVMAMTGIGAVTRLTESGLSITEWNVVSGTLPPITESDWAGEFSKYQATPEFAAKHHWMTLEDFKGIYFWEWFHRLWGRLIGIAFALPLAFFWVKGWIEPKDRLRFIGLFILGGSQGVLGWFMVKSGLVDQPSVSHFRLAAHLSLAMVIYCQLLAMAFRIRAAAAPIVPSSFSISNSLWVHALAAFGLVFTTLVWGAFVAGLDAGMIYNTFPLMGEGLVPPELGTTDFLHDPASIQFTHRALAILTGVTILALATRLYRAKSRLSYVMGGWVLVQIALGITTLLSVVYIPVAVAHQIGAVILLSIMTYTVWLCRRARLPA